MSEVSDILKQALKFVEPTQRDIDALNKVASKALVLVKEAASKFDGIVDVTFGGSYAKGTWLKDDVDVDIFVKIKQDLSEKEFERIGRELGFLALKKYKPYLRYSEHPYVEAFVGGTRVNVVPCYDVEKGKWKSAADRSPYHTQFVINSFDDEKRGEARLLKKFMKTIGVYGAEIAKNGFSGYVCEVLILKYGSFMNILKAAAEFGEKQVISIDKVNEDIVSMFKSPLIIIDPIDQRRNLGTAISYDSVGRMILAARKFIAKPELRFFRSMNTKKQTLRFADNIVVVKFKHKKRSPDIIWGQLKSSVNAVAKQLRIYGFEVIRATTATDEDENGIFAFMLESTQLPRLITKQGPKVFNHNDSVKFLNKNLDKGNLFWIGNDGRILALINNKFVDAAAFLKFLLSKNIRASGISQGLITDIKRGFDIYTGSRLSKMKEHFIREAISNLVTTDEFAFSSNKRTG